MTRGFAWTMPFGAEVRPGGVRFRLWAPAQGAVTLVLDPAHVARELPMSRLDDGWFECVTDVAGPGSRYAYALPDGTQVPDPASRFQPEDVHAASEVIDPHAYVWRHPDWRGRPWREAVIYEAHVGTFCAEGSHDGMRARLDHLAAIGVTALELMPLGAFAGRRNWGYDGVLPFAPDASYGRPDALKQLVDAAHARGLQVLLDVVYNHFGPSGNYLHAYAPQFFTDRWQTPWGAAIDFSHAEVRRFFIDNALYWLMEYRFDGLRLDAVDQIHDTAEPDILTELARTVHAHAGDRHVHLLLENDDNAARYLARKPARRYTAQWNDDFHHAAHVLATGEHRAYYIDYAPDPLAALARALAEGFVYQGAYSSWRQRRRGEPARGLSPLAFVNFLQNHDQVGNRPFGERLARIADVDAVAALTAIWLLAPAVPMLFMGQEWGAQEPFLFFCDYQGELAAAVRKGRRDECARFMAPQERQACDDIPDPNATSTFAASVLDWDAADTADGQRRIEYVRKLLALRRRHIQPRLHADLHGGTWEIAGRAMHVQWTLADGAQLHLAANPSAEIAPMPAWTLPGRVLYARPDSCALEAATRLPAWSVRWSLT